MTKQPAVELLEIKEFGNPILREVAKPIEKIDFFNRTETTLISSMRSTLSKKHGVGLAAPQIGLSSRIFIGDINRIDWKDKTRDIQICINPDVISSSKNIESDWEGCLSAPGWWGMVNRPNEIKVTFYNEFGKKIVTDLSGIGARIFQHELDHLNGILFVDRMEDLTTLMTDKEFEKINR